MAWKCARCGNTGSPNPPGVMGLTLIDHCILCKTEADDKWIRKVIKVKGDRQTIAKNAKTVRKRRKVK